MMASHLHLNSGQMSLFLTKFYQILAVFYILLIVVQATSSNENAINKFDNLPNLQNPDFMPRVESREPIREEELYLRPVFAKLPFELIYRMINENQLGFNPIERFRKYDPSDRSFIRFGRSSDASTQIKPNLLRQYYNYMKRPAGGDTSFLRFGKRSVRK